jgi:isoprenylcysteine carboxyl methyltransferase (ICMT) family protein YpbQ
MTCFHLCAADLFRFCNHPEYYYMLPEFLGTLTLVQAIIFHKCISGIQNNRMYHCMCAHECKSLNLLTFRLN